ncbi:MAG: AAA family ATPase [Phycisphaerales bacterium]|nr:AAA family ATPase [Phycisphaerales bacterium]
MAKKAAKKSGSPAARGGAAKPRKPSRGAPRGGGDLGVPAVQVRADAPISLDEVLGQGRAVGVLDASLASGRLHHAWIFHGPEGVGKFTTALAFAGVLLDPSSGPDLAGRVRPNSESETHRLLGSGTHPDLHVVRKELAAVSRDDGVRKSKQTTLALEVVLEFLIEPAERTRSLTGASRAGKVFIVDEAHMLGREAQNTMLKTIEEPAPGTVIVLVTPSEERLLPTIRSRCQRVAFGELDAAAMAAWMARSRLEVPEADREWALAFAGGSPGVLRAIVESGLGEWHRAIGPALEEMQRGVASIELGALFAKLVDEAASASVGGDAHASKDVANRLAARRMFRLVGESFRMAMRRAAAVGRTDEAEWAAGCIGLVEEAERQLGSNVSAGMVFENLAAQCPAT